MLPWLPRAVLLAAVLGSAVPALAGPDDAPTAAELAARPVFLDPALAPDGTHLAIRDGESLSLADLDGALRTRRKLTLPAGQTLDWFRWAGKDRLVLGLTAAGAKGPVHHIAALDLPGTALRWIDLPEGSGEARLIHVDPAGRFALASFSRDSDGAPAVYRIDLADGTAARIVKPQDGVVDWLADSAGVVRAGTSYAGRLLYRAHDGEAFRRAGRADSDGIAQLAPVRGSDQGYAMADGAGGHVALYRYDFAGGKLGALLYENPHADLDGYQTGTDGKVTGVRFADDRDRVLWFDAGMQRLQAEIDAKLPERVNDIASLSDTRAVLLSRAPDAPGSYYLYDRAEHRLTPLGDVSPALAAHRLAAMRSLIYRARDGLAIQAYLTVPQGRDPAALPLIVLPHGGPFARDSWEFDPWVQYLAGKGYAVLQPNYRGSTGFGHGFEAAGDGQWGRGMQDDVEDGVRWLAKAGTIDPKRVCIMGASYGGYAALWAAARDRGTYRCAISFAGISDVAAQLAYDRKTFERHAFRAWVARIQGDAPSLDSLSPVKLAGQVHMPLLIAQGLADTTVPPDQAAAMHAALNRLGRAHGYVTYPGEGHDLADPADTADFLDRVGAFLAEHNPS